MLKLQNVAVAYGQVQALKSVSLEVQSGQIVTIIGANGAGKSTTLKTISGLLRAAGGTIEFDGADLTRVNAEEIVRRGIVHVPEGRRLFPGLSVVDNLMLGASVRADKHKKWRAEAADDIEQVFTIFPPLRKLAHRLCWMLSGGEQQMCAIGRGLMARPRLLLTSRAWVLRRCLCGKCSKRLSASTNTARPFCWSNRTHGRRLPSPSMRTYWRRVAPCWKEMRMG